jgi:protein-S-isoprenylcysteine O-methyltransferase Ste14
MTLALRAGHRLVTGGVYRRIRHPMYGGLLLYALGQALIVPNWVAGPSNVVIMAVLVGCRLKSEEQMLREQFGDEYASYQARTRRLVPGVW